MSKTMNTFMAMALMLGGGMPSMRIPEPKEPRRKLPNYKHTGEIPHGCKLETHTILDIEVDIVFGSEKSKQKKLKKCEKEIREYMKNLLTP